MKTSATVAPPDEQKICVTCGFCCDGTLFLHAHLNPGERGHLPAKIEQAGYSVEGNDYFRLPCSYFDRKCTIYNEKKADVCSDYRCQLLKDFAVGSITLEGALAVVREGKQMRARVMNDFKKFSGRREEIYFKQLLREMGKIQESANEARNVSKEFEILMARCNIFEALLIKHFLFKGEFEKRVMK